MADPGEPTAPNRPNSFPPFVSVPFQPLHAKLFNQVFKLILNQGLFFNGDQQRRESPFQFRNPDLLRAEINFTLTKKGNSQETVLEALKKLIQFSPHHSHPFYLEKSTTAIDPYGIMAEFVSSALSTAVVTYFLAPVFTLMEEEVKRKIRKLIGYSELHGDGLICPGSGFATHLALRLCLQKMYPDLRNKGFAGIGKPKVCAFVSEHGGSSLEKAVIVLGLGSDACIRVKTDKLGRLDINDLKSVYKKAKVSKLTPIFVQAFAGTPLLGAIDPINEIADFCARKKLWLHVCADYGGAYLLYEEGNTRLKGIEKSDSVDWSPTEMLCAPYCITVLLTKYEKLCMETFGFHASYLFDPTDLYDMSYDNGDATIQTSRRPEIFKLWFMWKAKGKTALGAHVKYCDDLSMFAVSEILKRSNNLKLILPTYDTTRISFQFIPHKYMHFLFVGKINRRLKEALLLKGKMVIGLSRLSGQQDFLTISFTNSAMTKEDVVYILDEIVYVGKKLTMPLFDIFGTAEPKVPDAATNYSDFVSIPIESQHKSLFSKTFDLINMKGLYFQDERGEICYNFRTPMALLQEFDFELKDTPIVDEGQIVQILEQTIFYSIHQAHPYYVYQLLAGGLDPYGIMAVLMLTTMRTNMLTYENAPVYTLMEEELFKVSRQRIGYPNGGDGMLCPGGSIAIISSIHVAKVWKYPEVRVKGLTLDIPKRLVIYISRNAHYCSNKGSALQGIGLDNCILVDADSMGRMSVPALTAAIESTLTEGGTPFFVVATAGTTVLGAVDPLNDIADVCEKYKLWFHVDGSIGGSVMMSDKYKALYLNGAERSHSFNYNPHKMYGIVQETAIVVYRQKNVVKAAFGFKNPYGTPKSTLYNSAKYDNCGARGGLQSSRRPNALKFWLLWKKKGYEGMADEVEYMYQLKDFALQELNRRSDRFIPFLPDFDMPNVCFYYIPISLRHLDRNSPDFKERINQVGVPLARKLTLVGHMITGCLSDPDLNTVLKFVLFNSSLTFADIKYMLDEIDYYGKDLVA